MQTANKEWSGYHIIWPLADALQWRCDEYSRDIKEAFSELAKFCTDGRIKAVGIFAGSHPTRPMDRPTYSAWRDPPTSHPINTPMLGVIPAAEWSDLLYVLDANQRPTSELKYASARLPAWRDVQFDRDPLVVLWQSIPAEAGNPKQTRMRKVPEMETFVTILKASQLKLPTETLLGMFKDWYEGKRKRNLRLKRLPEKDDRKLKAKLRELVRVRLQTGEQRAGISAL